MKKALLLGLVLFGATAASAGEVQQDESYIQSQSIPTPEGSYLDFSKGYSYYAGTDGNKVVDGTALGNMRPGSYVVLQLDNTLSSKGYLLSFQGGNKNEGGRLSIDIYSSDPISDTEATPIYSTYVDIAAKGNWTDKDTYSVGIPASIPTGNLYMKNTGDDRTHDYFYHNMGQRMTVTSVDGCDLSFTPTDELAFAGGHLYAYSYIYDKEVADGSNATRTQFVIDMPDSTETVMTMWMNGSDNRRVFKALSPMTEGLSRMPNMPYDIKNQPTLTFVARQDGEAWSSPFAAVFEPSSTTIAGTISHVSYPDVTSDNASDVAFAVLHTDGGKDLIISSDKPELTANIGDVSAKASFAFVNDNTYFISNGTSLAAPNVKFTCTQCSDILLVERNGVWFYSSTAPCKIKLYNKTYNLPAASELSVINTKNLK